MYFQPQNTIQQMFAQHKEKTLKNNSILAWLFSSYKWHYLSHMTDYLSTKQTYHSDHRTYDIGKKICKCNTNNIAYNICRTHSPSAGYVGETKHWLRYCTWKHLCVYSGRTFRDYKTQTSKINDTETTGSSSYTQEEEEEEEETRSGFFSLTNFSTKIWLLSWTEELYLME